MTDSVDGIIGWRWLDVRLRRRARRQVRAQPAPSRLRRTATAAVVQIGALATRLLAESTVTVLRRDARAGDHSGAVRRSEPGAVIAGWPALAAGVVAKNASSLPERCDADVARTASPFAVTPPLGRRIEMLAETPPTLPADPEESAETDVELRPMYRRLVRDLRNG